MREFEDWRSRRASLSTAATKTMASGQVKASTNCSNRWSEWPDATSSAGASVICVIVAQRCTENGSWSQLEIVKLVGDGAA